MKRTSSRAFLLCLGVAALVFGQASLESRPAAAAPPHRQQQAAESQTSSTRFVGTIVSLNGDRFILRDDAHDTWYHLDDQQTAGKYCGKRVAITGTLDGRFDMIHMHSIEESKS